MSDKAVRQLTELRELAEGMKDLSVNERNDLMNLVENEYYFRRDMVSHLLDPRRDVYKECGWVASDDNSSLSPQLFLDLYERFPIAARVVDLPVDESWKQQPQVIEDDDTDNETEFEKAWKGLDKMIRGDLSWYDGEEGSPIWSTLEHLDRMSRIGEYGILVMEFDDTPSLDDMEVEGFRHWEKPAPGFEEADKEGIPSTEQVVRNAEAKKEEEKATGKKSSKVKLVGCRVFDQSHVEIDSWNSDQESPLFGWPQIYRVTVGDDSTRTNAVTGTTGSHSYVEREIKVHWSRIIHLCPNPIDSDYIGNSALKVPLNDLQDLQKIYGASGEGYWRNAFPGLSFESHPSLGGKANLDTESIKKQIEGYQHTFQRYLATVGGTVKTIAGTVVEPLPHVETRIEAICIYLGCPVRIFKGSERGQLASTQDKDSWDERMMRRQHRYIIPKIVVPFIDRLIAVGVLPIPSEGYRVKWPDFTALSQLAKADLATKMTTAWAMYIEKGLDALMSPLDYFVKVWEFDKDEAQQFLDNAVEHINSANPDADDITEPGETPVDPMMKAAQEATLNPPDDESPPGTPKKPPTAIPPSGKKKVKGEVENTEGEYSLGFILMN